MDICSSGTGSSAEDGFCRACDPAEEEYQALTSHFNSKCNPQPACPLGTFYTATVVAERTCTTCPENTYQVRLRPKPTFDLRVVGPSYHH